MDTFTAILGLIVGSILSFIAPVQPFLVMAFALIVCDLYTSFRAARHRKEVMTEAGIGRSIEKMTLYFIAIILAEMFRVTFLKGGIVDSFPIVYIVAITISIRELQCNYENIHSATGTNLWENIKEKMSSIIDIFKTK